MHHFGRSIDVAAKRLADALVPEQVLILVCCRWLLDDFRRSLYHWAYKGQEITIFWGLLQDYVDRYFIIAKRNILAQLH